jgi:hypothetical protein
MSCQPPAVVSTVAIPHVWAGLPTDLQQHAVRLLAQLAQAQLRSQKQLVTQEIQHGQSTQQPQDSSRSS